MASALDVLIRKAFTDLRQILTLPTTSSVNSKFIEESIAILQNPEIDESVIKCELSNIIRELEGYTYPAVTGNAEISKKFHNVYYDLNRIFIQRFLTEQ